MPTVPVQNPPRVIPTESIEQRFRHLESQWQADTEFLSDAGKIVNHPAFKAIVALGDEIVPNILHDLATRPSLLVWALPELTGANPVSAANSGNLRKMTDDWLKWSA